MAEENKTEKLADLDYDIWINLLNVKSYEEIGKLVVQKLMEAPTNKHFSRKIIVCGS